MAEGIKQLNIYFSLNEYNKLLKVKKEKKLSWHDLFLSLIENEKVDEITAEIKKLNKSVIGSNNVTKHKL